MQPETQTLADLRHRVLNRLTWVILALGGAAAVAASVEEIGSGRPSFVLLYGITYAVVAVFALTRRFPYRLRAVVLLSALFAVGLSELYFFGFPSLAFLFFFSAVTLSGVLLSLRTGIWALSACLATILAAAAAYALRLVPITTQTQVLSSTLRFWISPTASFLLLSTACMVFLSLLMRDLDRHIRSSQENLRRAEEELAARRKAEEQLLHAQRMEALGRLAGTVAHDFNNYLTTILGYSELMQSAPASSRDFSEGLESIRTAAHSASSLTRQLLAFSRKQIVRPEVFPLNELIENLQTILRRLAGDAVRVELELDPEAGNLEADRGQIEQVLLNLVSNARDAMPQGGRLAIRTKAEPGRARIGLSVADTGIGMDRQARQRIFEPFFTTKPRGKGVGLGLSTVYGIVQQSAGSIEVHSEPGLGSTFLLHLPRSLKQPLASGARMQPVRDLQGSQNILVAEDDAPIRRLIAAGLTRLGYKVGEAADGSAARELCKAEAQGVELLIADLALPDGDGYELALWARREKPGLRVLLISGNSDEITSRLTADGCDFPLLPKPFNVRQLAQRVREILDADT